MASSWCATVWQFGGGGSGGSDILRSGQSIVKSSFVRSLDGWVVVSALLSDDD